MKQFFVSGGGRSRECRKNNLLHRFTTICCRAFHAKYVNGLCTAEKAHTNKLQLSCLPTTMKRRGLNRNIESWQSLQSTQRRPLRYSYILTMYYLLLGQGESINPFTHSHLTALVDLFVIHHFFPSGFQFRMKLIF